MSGLLRSGWLAAVSAWVVCTFPGVVRADDAVWQSPVLAQIPSAISVGNEAVSNSGSSAGKIIVAAAWADAADWEWERDHGRVIAFDLASGARAWQRDLDADCSRPQHLSFASVRDAVALFPNGDVAVASFAHDDPGSGHAHQSVCYARLDGGDGHILWSARDVADPSATTTVSLLNIAVDASGDLILIEGKGEFLRAAKFSGIDGSLAWTHEESLPGRSLDGAPTDIGPDGAIDIMAGTRSSDAHYELRMFSLDGGNGALRWVRLLCADASVSPGRPLRALADGSIAFFDTCAGPDAATLSVGRLAGADGAVIWQHGVGGSYRDYQIDTSGDLILAGALNVDGAATAMARYAADDGHVVFALAGVLGGPEPGQPDISSVVKMALGDGSVHVWELLGQIYPQGISPGRVSRYDAATGQLLSRTDLAEPAFDYLFRYGQQMKALPGGDVWLADLSTHAGGGWFWHARMQASTQLAWNANEPVAAAQPLLSERDERAGHSTLAALNAGVAGVVVGGRASIDMDDTGYLYLAKLAQDDGRELWHWQPQPFVPDSSTRLDGILVDSAGAIFVVGAGADASWNGAPLLAKLDAASGQTLWLRFEDATNLDLGPHSLALDRAGNPFVLSALHLQRHASADGATVWSVDLPDGDDSADSARIVVDGHGDAIVAAPYESASERGLQVGKMRGSDGAILWWQRFPDPSFFTEIGRLALLSNGDVAMTAQFSDDQPWLARLSGTDGSLLWLRRDIVASDLLVDGAGQIILSYSELAQAQLYRLDAANGDTLWTIDYIGAGLRASTAVAGGDEGGKITHMALAANGDLLVTGNTVDVYGVAAIAVADGSQRWFASAQAGAGGYPVGVVEGSGGHLFVAGDAQTAGSYITATLFDIAGAFNESIFANGFE